MAQMTKDQLAAENAALRHNMNQLEIERDGLRTQLDTLSAKHMLLSVAHNALLVEQRPSRGASRVRTAATPKLRRVFEFDPNVDGDFARANAAARDVPGAVVRRAQA